MSDARAEILLQFMRTKLVADAASMPTETTRLVTERVVDSMGLVLLAAFVEERFGIRIDDADFRAGEMETIADVIALIDRRR
jgi:acyl carrier protein